MLRTHPSPSGKGGRRIPHISTGKESQDELESNFVRCAQCGFPNNLKKVQHGDSMDRNKDFIVTTEVTLSSGGTESVREFNDAAMGGCRFCHSTNIEGHRPLRESVRKPPAGYTGG